MADYTGTYTTFSGADVVVFMNGVKVIGELQSVTWQRNLQEISINPINGTMTTTLFDRECPLMKYKDEPFDVLLLYFNEYGQSKAEYILGVNLQTVSTGISVDDIVQEAKYTFTAREAGIIEDFPVSGNDKAEWIRNFLNGKDIENLSYKDKKVLDIVQRHLLYQIADMGWELIHKSELHILKMSPQEKLTHQLKRQLREQEYGMAHIIQ